MTPATIAPPRSPRQAGATVIRLPINLGVGGALRAGFRYAVDNGADTVVQVDGDGQHPIDQIEALLKHLDAGDFDMVVGSRFAPGGVAVAAIQTAAIGNRGVVDNPAPPRRSDDQ